MPDHTEMANVTVFVDVANIAQYTKQQVTHCSSNLHLEVSLAS